MEEGVVKVSGDELLPDGICAVFEQESRRKSVPKVCEGDGGEAGAADSVVEKGYVGVEKLFFGDNSVLK